MQYDSLTNANLALVAVIVAWDMIWKGFALWRAAHDDSKVWFVVLLIVNSVGILPIVYLLLNKYGKSTKS